MDKETIRKYIPAAFLAVYRQLYWRLDAYQKLKQMNPRARHLMKLSKKVVYADVPLETASAKAAEEVFEAASSIYGGNWNYYSDALRRENIKVFEESIDAIEKEKIDYLEIGSCQGLSLAVIGKILKGKARLGSLISIDPYFDDGYVEGKHGPSENAIRVNIDKKTKALAFRLYEELGLGVHLYEMPSLNGLKNLISEGSEFDLIYVDGSHEKIWPTIDFSLSYSLLRQGGVIMLDDHLWPDVEPIKKLCDKYASKIYESWKVAAYKF